MSFLRCYRLIKLGGKIMIPLSAKEKEKLGHLYVKYSRLIWYVSVRIVRDEGLAEDMTHDTFLKVANQIDSVKAVEGIKTKCFLITIAKHLCVDYFRKMKAKKMDYSYNLDSLLDQAPLPLDQVCQNERNTALHIALQSLDEDYQEVLYLRFVSELNNHEIAQALDITPEYAAVKIMRAKKALKKALEAYNAKYGDEQIF